MPISIIWRIGNQIDPERMKELDAFEIYKEKIRGVCGEEGDEWRISDDGEDPPVHVILHKGVPGEGYQTSFSFGLSSLNHPDWIHSRPELVLCVESKDPLWSAAMGEMIRMGWGGSNFTWSKMFNFGSPIAKDSGMDSFLIHACTVLDEEDLTIVLPDRKIHLSQVYPMYHSEVQLAMRIGVEAFLDRVGDDLLNIHRVPIA